MTNLARQCCWLLVASLLLACSRRSIDSHGHDHGDDHGHRAHEAEGPEPLSITKWTAQHELFVEFPPPSPGKPVAYHAHVTKLEGFQALNEGTFTVRYKTNSAVAAETKISGVKRPGIFAPEGMAPKAGTYTLEMVVQYGPVTDVFDCGSISIQDGPPSPQPEAAGAAINFLKESQWKIPFSTGWAEEHLLAKEIELPAVVEPAGTDQLVIGAPTGGRFFHNPKLGLAEGRQIRKGDIVGSIVPNVAGEDYSRLQLTVEEARLAKQQTEREITRVEPLVQQELLPERRLIELRNDLETQSARLTAAQGRLGRVLTPGGAGGLSIRSTLEGVVSHVLVPNGEPVEAGAPLARIGGTTSLWLRMRFVARPASSFPGARPAAVRLPSGERLDLDGMGARLLSALPVVEPSSRLATWVIEVAPSGGQPPEAGANQPALQAGTPVVALLRIGEPRNVLAVPRQAVIEIDTRPFVFVQVDGEHFEKRAVTLGNVDGTFIEVTSGVSKGERIVTSGGFDVHLASLMGSVESHRH